MDQKTFSGRPILLVFRSPASDPSQDEVIREYERQLGSPQVERRVPSEAESRRLAEHYGVDGKGGVVFLDEAGAVKWKQSGALQHPDQLPKASARNPDTGWNRREFLATSGLAALIVIIPPAAHAAAHQVGQRFAPGEGPGAVPVKLNVNTVVRDLMIEPRVTLLDALRERLNLTGAKKGCDHGQCGACTVLIDGVRVNSCLTLAIAQQGKKIQTIEGLAHGEDLHPIQAAFLEHDAFQCGYCTPGQIMSTVGLLSEKCGVGDAEVRECMSGNICRCAAYDNIVSAVQSVRGNSRDQKKGARA